MSGIPTALNEMSTRPALRSRTEMLVHSLLVERVDLRRLGGSAGGNDVLGDRFDRCQVAPGEKELGPSRAKARATAPPIAPPAP